jgi:hypothetical protein
MADIAMAEGVVLARSGPGSRGAEGLSGSAVPHPRLSSVLLRGVAHAAGATPFVVSCVRTIRHGWLPVADTAAISIRAWDVLGAHGPLVGQRTSLSGVYDLGPLEYWLLSLPVHLDPAHGSLWGAALCCILAASLAIEAAWSAFGPAGGALASAVVLGCVAWFPTVALNPTWNPHVGIIWFLATFASACAVMCGRLWWWPVLVGSASVAMQCHLMFALASGGLVLICLATGLVTRKSRRGGYAWLVTGVGVGMVCWMAPVIQQFTGSQGNMSRLISSQHFATKAGLGFGLRSLGAAVLPRTLWWRGLEGAPSATIVRIIESHSVLSGVVALLFVTFPLAVAWRVRSRRLAALAAVTILSALALVATFANIPRTGMATVAWLVSAAYPVGVLAWIAMASALGLIGWRLLQARDLAATGGASGPTAVRGRLRALVPLGWAAVFPLGLLVGVSLAQQADDWPAAFEWRLVPVVSTASLRIERAIPPQQVRILVDGPNQLNTYAVVLGVAARLDAAGYRPEVSGFPMLAAVGPNYRFTPGAPLAVVSVEMSGSKTRTTVSFHDLES